MQCTAETSSLDMPRLGLLWGCSVSNKDYDLLARYDLLVTGGAATDPGWETFPVELRKRNPYVKILNTSTIAYMSNQAVPAWMKDEWFLKRPDGSKVAWWAEVLIVPNLMIDECFNALLDNCIKTYEPLYKKGLLDGFFMDSMVGRLGWLGEVDLNGDGIADDPVEIDSNWHARQNLFFDRMREMMPGVIVIANDVDLDHMLHVNGRFFEGGRLFDRIFAPIFNYTMHTPQEIIYLLNERIESSLKPEFTYATMTHPLGWQFWRLGKTGHGSGNTTPGEVDRASRDYQRMRIGLTTALMTDSYFSYDFGTIWWGHRFWYAEYEAPLGKPLGPYKEVFITPPVSVLDWKAGNGTNAWILGESCRVTPNGIECTVENSDASMRRLVATSGEAVILKPGKRYRVIADCEILQRTEETILHFQAGTEKGGEAHRKGIHQNELKLNMDEAAWHIDTLITPDNYDDYKIEWHCSGPATLLIRSLKVMEVNGSYLRRDFEGGTALVNPTYQPVAVELEQDMWKLQDDAAPRYVIEVDDDSPESFSTTGDWEKLGGEAHYYDSSYRLSKQDKASAQWIFTTPAADIYTVFANAPGGESLTDKAVYTASGVTADLDQKKGDGGWMKLFDVKLKKGQRCEIRVENAGKGSLTADAVRVESAARYNDGKRVKSISIDPMDGIILTKSPCERTDKNMKAE